MGSETAPHTLGGNLTSLRSLSADLGEHRHVLPVGMSNVTVTSGGSTVDDSGVITGGGTFTFTASTKSGRTYQWYIDGTADSDTNILEVDTSGWTSGIYNILLEASDSFGKYSYFAQIKIN